MSKLADTERLVDRVLASYGFSGVRAHRERRRAFRLTSKRERWTEEQREQRRYVLPGFTLGGNLCRS